jgi:hypothetical protein
MDLRKIIHELEIEKQRLDEAIIALERLSAGSGGNRPTNPKPLDGIPKNHDSHEARAGAAAASGPTHSARK